MQAGVSDEVLERAKTMVREEDSHMFVSPCNPLGCTDLIQLKSAPLVEPGHRMSNPKEEYAEEHVQKLLEHDIVEPIKSPWCATVIFAKKKGLQHSSILEKLLSKNLLISLSD